MKSCVDSLSNFEMSNLIVEVVQCLFKLPFIQTLVICSLKNFQDFVFRFLNVFSKTGLFQVAHVPMGEEGFCVLGDFYLMGDFMARVARNQMVESVHLVDWSFEILEKF